MNRRHNLLIPVSLLAYALTNKKTKQLRIYLCLKSNLTGVACINYNQLGKELGMTEKTLKRHIKWLLENNWIGTDGKLFYVRKWKRLPTSFDPQFRCGTYLEDTDYLKNEEIFKAFAVSAVYAHIIRGQKAAKFNRVRRERRTVPRSNLAASGSYYGVSSTLLASVLGMSKTKAVELKQLAIKHNFIKSIHHFKEYPKQKTTKDAIKVLHKQGKTALFLKQGVLVEQLFDEILVFFAIKRVRKNRLSNVFL